MLVVLTSLACGVAPNVAALIAARIIQGATAALLIPQVLATFHQVLEGERKARAVALYGATSGIAAVVGQLVGGLLVGADIAGTSWRPIFLVNVPIGVAVLIVAARIVPGTRSPHPVGIDLPGTVLFAATLTALLIPLAEGHSLGWPWRSWLLPSCVRVSQRRRARAETAVRSTGSAQIRTRTPNDRPSSLTNGVATIAYGNGMAGRTPSGASLRTRTHWRPVR
ncbi:MFS transporter [Streptomyces sp. NPDC020298]|uniref:MFS transporter n=1 Tax=unclassified Streptomyces TaxID=2593676 RepID=UPI0033F6F064